MPISFWQKKDPCEKTPSIGTVCDGGALFAGVFDGGKYMITPGNCTDSTTPVCNDATDSLYKSWNGTSGGFVDITGVENLTDFSKHSSPSARGNILTPLIVADASISSDSVADFCNDMVFGGYSDWYLPSKSELVYLGCHTSANYDSGNPSEVPDCTQFGGKTTSFTSFSIGRYWSSTEHTGTYPNLDAVTIWMGSGVYDDRYKSAGFTNVRCMRRYHESEIDKSPDTVNWSDFVGTSSSESLNNFDATIFLELTATNSTGTPSLEYQVNTLGWNSFTTSNAELIAIRSGDTLQFRATGTSFNSATITIKNATDDAVKPTLDSILATVP